MKESTSFFETKDIKDFKPVIQGLEDVFEQEHWATILCWCGLIDNDPEDFGKYWKVWLIQYREKTVGFCGLYSPSRTDNSVLFLGWFGMLPQYRGIGFGGISIEFMKSEAKKAGAKKILTYVDNQRSLQFYERNSFVPLGTVQEYTKLLPLFADHFGEPEHIVMGLNIDL